MKGIKAVALLALVCLGVTTLTGCAVEHRRDGGITVRPLH